MPDVDTFRAETRAWLEQNCPPSMRTAHARRRADRRRYTRDLQERRLQALARPHGGERLDRADLADASTAAAGSRERRRGCSTRRCAAPRLPPAARAAWASRCSARRCSNTAPRSRSASTSPPIVRGEIRWCQGYSRAGRRLRPRQPADARACRDGDALPGQRPEDLDLRRAIMPTGCFCLVRTDPTAKKHEGISFLLIDMATPGVRSRPIQLISGTSPFCETFFDDVRVPADEPGRRD